MLIAGCIAFALGLLEFFLNTQAFPAVFEAKYAKVGLMLLLKLAIYGLGIAALIVKFRAYAVPAAIGFGAGFGLYLLIYGGMKILKKDG